MPELLDHAAVDAAIAMGPWERKGDEITCTVKNAGFLGSLSFVNAVGYLAEAANHHPDIDIRWDTVTLTLSTHSAGGLTTNDVELAAAIDRLRS